MEQNLESLHQKLQKHLDEQSKNWKSFIYAQKLGFYQGYNAIKLKGCRPTETRFDSYNIEKYLSKDKIALDIGSNCGFFTLHLSKYLKFVEGIEVNPYLIKIAEDTKEFLKIDNVKFHNSSFEDFNSVNNFDVIFSLSNDSTIDRNTKFNFTEYIDKVFNLLKEGGILIFESQAEDVMYKKFEPKREKISEMFTVLEQRMVKSEYPVNVPERFFLVLQKT